MNCPSYTIHLWVGFTDQSVMFDLLRVAYEDFLCAEDSVRSGAVPFSVIRGTPNLRR